MLVTVDIATTSYISQQKLVVSQQTQEVEPMLFYCWWPNSKPTLDERRVGWAIQKIWWLRKIQYQLVARKFQLHNTSIICWALFLSEINFLTLGRGAEEVIALLIEPMFDKTTIDFNASKYVYDIHVWD